SKRTSGADSTTPLAVGCGRANGTFTGVARKLRTLGGEECTNYSLIFIRWGEFSEDKKPPAKNVPMRATSGRATVSGSPRRGLRWSVKFFGGSFSPEKSKASH